MSLSSSASPSAVALDARAFVAFAAGFVAGVLVAAPLAAVVLAVAVFEAVVLAAAGLLTAFFAAVLVDSSAAEAAAVSFALLARVVVFVPEVTVRLSPAGMGVVRPPVDFGH